MASKPETTYTKAVNRLLPKALHAEKMNNPFRGGTADYWYSGSTDDLWVEYKWLARLPKKEFDLTAGKEPPLSGLQQKWLRERHDEGRNVAVVIGCPTGGMILRYPDWELPVTPAFIHSRLDIAGWIIKETTDAKNKGAIDRSHSNNTHL